MLTITVPETELYDEKSQEFFKLPEVQLELEHSLVSLSKWESKWEKPFISTKDKTTEETVDYIRLMTLTPDIAPEVFSRLSENNFKEVNSYIEAKMTATWFREEKTVGVNHKIITAEIIYYYMVSLTIPFECQYWHLNRLLTLIRVCNQENAPKKPMGKQELAARNRALNEARLAKHNTTG